MKSEASFNVVSGRESCIRYACLPLYDLIRRIVDDSDSDALREFHDHRTIFSLLEDSRLLFAEYVDRLRLAAEGQWWSSLSLHAYDLTVDKFSRLPRAGDSGVDCRNYFRAALRVFADHLEPDELRRELILADILQRLVHRHFEWSLKESHRNFDMTRFDWMLPLGSIGVLLPRSLSGSARRRWLEEHVPHPDPRRPGERDHIQMIIQQHFGSGCAVAFDDAALPESVLPPSDRPGFFEASLSVNGLAATVAQEKADRWREQRPAIQQLGPSRLKEMILRIFEDIGAGDFREGAVAREFRLSKATFSRFCGTHWTSMPDLWRNTARVLASRKEVIEVIRELGIRPRFALAPSSEGIFCK